MSRYARQEILPEVGPDGQKRLAEAHILVVGAGGLGSAALPLLAGAGVGTITIVDGDRVNISNLHRQTLFSESDTGRAKAEVAAERCRALNSEIVVESKTLSLTPANAPGLVETADIVLDCADSYAASYTLSDECYAMGTLFISAAILGFSGYAGGFCGGAPSLRAVFPNAPENAANCASAGVIGPAVAILGAVQAQMTLAVILRLDPSPLGLLHRIDAKSFKSQTFRFDGAEEPARAHPFAAPTDLRDDDLIVELRSVAEAPTPAHPAAIRLAPEEIRAPADHPGQRLALCCATGLRAWRAAETLQDNWPGEIVLVAASTS
ncbi:MAG: thiazole biosynthesis adenylyltransferase ThiF [Pseudomonadota bacterium]